MVPSEDTTHSCSLPVGPEASTLKPLATISPEFVPKLTTLNLHPEVTIPILGDSASGILRNGCFGAK